MLRCLAVVGVLGCVAGVAGVAAAAEDLEFRAPAAAHEAETAAAMRSLAVRALPVYENASREQFLTNLSALQMVAGEYAAAHVTRESLRELREHERSARGVDEALIYDLYAQARAIEAKSRVPFDQAFARVFRAAVSPLGDRAAYTLGEWLATPLSLFRGNLQRELDRLHGTDRVSLAEAVDLAWTYLSFEAFRSFGPLVGPLVAEDDRARYLIDDPVRVRAAGADAIEAVVVRQRSAPARLAALLEFAPEGDPRDAAKESAAHGYAGVVAYARGRGAGREAAVPDEHGGDDARAVVGWIAAQPWSDGRVGMYGSGYGAWLAWAAAKRPPPALKALAVASAPAPGIEAPREDRGEGLPAALYRHWLEHPGFDRFWQTLMPYGRDFARLAIPVLTTTGYFDPNQAGSLHYFMERARSDPSAPETLLIGPYDGDAMQRGPLPVLAGYSLDEAAIIDLHELLYGWFDHVLKGAASPDLLTERVNFEVMGADAWRHADSLEAMANGAVRLYLDGTRMADHYRLSGYESPRTPILAQPIEPAAEPRARGPATDIMTRALPPGGAVFVSGPLHRPLQVSGQLSGKLAFATGRSGLALGLRLYELQPSGAYLQILAPPEQLCGECAPGTGSRPRELDFRIDRLTSIELQAGSRIVVVIDATTPVTEAQPSAADHRPGRRAGSARRPRPQVQWYGGSYIELPAWR